MGITTCGRIILYIINSMSEYYTLGSWNSQGVPNYLSSVITIPPDTISRVIKTLPEKSNLAVTHPDYITSSVTRNIIIQTTNPLFEGADVHVTFLYEGAGYRNVLGYYVYSLNGGYTVPTKWNGTAWVPMTYADRNSVNGSGKSSLKKTIIFPNASLPTWANSNGLNSMAGGGNLLPGSTVRLVYDTANPDALFPNNTGIGFFLIPNGWNGSTFYNSSERIYSDSVFNTAGSVQTVLLYDSVNSDSDSGTMVISFEDIMRPGGDSDFNDLIIQASYTPSYAISTSGSLVLPSSTPINADTIVVDRTGMYLNLTDLTFSTISLLSTLSVLTIRHEIQIDDDSNGARTLLYDNLKQFDLENGATVTLEDNKIVIYFEIPKNSFHKYNYVFSSFRNIDKTSSYNSGVSAIVEFQNLYVRNRDCIVNEKLTLKNKSTNLSYIDDQDFSPSVIDFDSPYAMGDPHILTITGDKYDLPNVTQTYVYYDDGELEIIIHVDSYPFNKPYDIFRDLTFIKYVQIKFKNEIVIANLFHIDTYYQLKDNKRIKIDLLNKPDSVFELNASYPLYNQRRMHHESLTHTFQSNLRYIHFQTAQLGDVWIELFHIPHRKDYVNSLSILSDNLSFVPNVRGIIARQHKKDLIDNLPYFD